MIYKIVLAVLLLPSMVFGFTMPQEISVSMPSDSNKYYVDLDLGSGGSGSVGDPWGSLQGAESGVNGQSRPLYIYMKGTDEASSEFVWDEGGSSGNEVVITAWGAETATIGRYFRVSASYIIFDGLSQATPQLVFTHYGTNTRAFRINAGDSYTTLWRCEVDGTGRIGAGLSTTNFGGDNMRIYNNRFHDSGAHNLYIHDGSSPQIKGNLVYDAVRNGCQFNPHEVGELVTDAIVSGNAIYDNAESGLYVGTTGSSGAFLTGVDVYNNIAWNNGTGSDGDLHVIEEGGGTISDIVIYNNTFYDEIEWDYNGGTFKANIYGSISGDNTPSTTDNRLTASANFVSETVSSADYLKLSASDNASTDTSPPVIDDYFGNSRNASTPDIGASEYTVGGDITCYLDADNDLYGAGSQTQPSCDEDYYEASPHFDSGATTGDCNDSDATINPGATETCDGVDENCNEVLDGSEGITQQCGTTDVGLCEYGTEDCTDIGGWENCDSTEPTTEICGNSLDESCSGADLPCEKSIGNFTGSLTIQ